MGLPSVEINHYEFGESLHHNLSSNSFAKDLWPLVYIISDGETKTAYVGETTDAYARRSAHLKHEKKSKLTSVHLIASEKFNKSATLDIESNLIKYMSGDNYFKLLNGNLGLANHNYYQKDEVYQEVFQVVWNKLMSEGITRHSLQHIDNSDLFKYSPYKSLTHEQTAGLIEILEGLVHGTHKNTVVEGGAGTGKTILAIFLFKMLSSRLEDFSYKEFGEEDERVVELVQALREKLPNPKMALVVPMSSFRSTLKKVFRNISGLKSSMVIGPSEVSKNTYDLLVVDESHRLRRRVNLGAYYGAFDKACITLGLDKMKASELDWVLMRSKNAVLFYDEDQSIKPSDARMKDFTRLKNAADTRVMKLRSQFRVKGGNAFVRFVDDLLNCKVNPGEKAFDPKNYDFKLYESLEDMVGDIQAQNKRSGLSRLIAGYSWKWISKKDPEAFDIRIGDVKLKWNGTANDWINSPNSVNEVGCIHTTQGYDLNYSGIIFGNEISYDPEKEEIVILEENYYDKNGKQSIEDPEELKSFILNIYKTIMLRGIRGTYVYACDPKLRAYFKTVIPVHAEEQESPVTLYEANEVIPFEDAVPVYDLQAAAGEFGEVQKPENVHWVKLPSHLKADEDLFACRVIGESMNKIIPSDSICLFRKYRGGSRNGRIVIVEHTELQDPDTGSSYTVKEYQSKKTYDEQGWEHQEIILKPRSTEGYKPIILEKDDMAMLKVIGVFECIL